MDEKTLISAYRIVDRPWDEAELTEDDLLRAYSGVISILASARKSSFDGDIERHPCPGDGMRGCGVRIPVERPRCRFCTKTIRLRDGVT